MTSESKVLTVSYGAFSCTLEGFDDPFDTMKVIAEYFRDLAQNDRHFGAEPPPPDAAMLHRAAEREISRLVENRREDKAPQPGGPDAGPETRDPVDLTGGMAPLPDRTPAPNDTTSPVEPSLRDEIPKGFTAKLARIRAASAQPPVAPPLPDDQLRAFMPDLPVPPMSEPEADSGATATEADAVGPTDDLSLSPDDIQTQAPPHEAEATSLSGMEPAAEVEAEAEASDPGPAATDTEDLLAEPLTVEPPAPEAEAGTDLIVTALAPDADLPVDNAYPLDASAIDPAIEDPLPEDTFLADDGVFADEHAEDAYLDMHPAPVDEAAEAAPAASDDASVTIADLDPPADPTAAMTDTVADAGDLAPSESLETDAFAGPVDLSSPEADLVADPASEETAEISPEAPGGKELQTAPPSAKGQGRYERVSSRVVRINRDEDGPDTDTAATPADPKPDPDMTRIVRNRGADVEMSRLLRQAENVLADEENRRRHEAIAMMKAAVVVAETDRTESETGEVPPKDKRDAYREDLAQAVEPMPAPVLETPQPKRRKTRSVRLPDTRPGTIRPNTFSPPPLVLVTEQRIDRAPPSLASTPPVMTPETADQMPEPQDTGRESPPRVALRTGRLTGAIGIGSAAVSFAHDHQGRPDQVYPAGQFDPEDEDEFDESLSPEIEQGLFRFSERLGLTSTVEMLEAAAAFATSVENRSQFTRPQLMHRLLASAPKGAINREDGLRSFGTLLRTGRIEKIGRGYYALSSSSRFLAEARRFS